MLATNILDKIDPSNQSTTNDIKDFGYSHAMLLTYIGNLIAIALQCYYIRTPLINYGRVSA